MEFLEKANERIGEEYDSLFRPAIEKYRLVSENLDEVEKLFPLKGKAEEELRKNIEDAEKKGCRASQIRQDCRSGRTRSAEENICSIVISADSLLPTQMPEEPPRSITSLYGGCQIMFVSFDRKKIRQISGGKE